jgi:hypothetical protein
MQTFSWKNVIMSISFLASFGGLLLQLLAPNGYFRKKNTSLDCTIYIKVFKNTTFRKVTSGYFAHMWELCTF